MYDKAGDMFRFAFHASSEETEKLRIKGLGFRGEVMGKMLYAGLDPEKLSVNGADIEDDAFYTIATIDMFTLGTLFPAIRDAEGFTPNLKASVLEPVCFFKLPGEQIAQEFRHKVLDIFRIADRRKQRSECKHINRGDRVERTDV